MEKSNGQFLDTANEMTKINNFKFLKNVLAVNVISKNPFSFIRVFGV